MHDTLESRFSEDTYFQSFARAEVAMTITNPNLHDNPIVYVNQAFTRLTGYPRSAVIGQNCRFLQGEETHKTDVDLIREGIEVQDTVTVDLLNYRANGEPFTNRLILAPITDDAGQLQYYMGIQKELQTKELAGSANEINAQLMEVQARVQSDLSMIIGMIRQQSSGASSAPEDFAALARRIETLQLLYEEIKLAEATPYGHGVQMGSYLSRLTTAIAHIEGRPGVRLNMQVSQLVVPIETATRVGLVLSELLTNAFQHAFDRLDMGLVEVRMSALSGGGLRLTVSDDGVGIPKEMDWPDTQKVGGRIVSGLIEGLDGTLQLGRGAAGSFVTIDVPASEDMFR